MTTTTAPVAARDTYNRGGVIAASCVGLAIFLSLWLLNGYFTARTAAGLGRFYAVPWLTWGAGWCIHLIISVAEQHSWKIPHYAASIPALRDVLGYLVLCMWFIAVAVGSADVLTTAVGLIDFFGAVSFTAQIVCVILAELIAVLPEPLIVGLVILLYRLIRR